MLVNGTITITGDAVPEPETPPARTQAQIPTARKKDERNEGVILKNCAPFTGCISEMNNT